MPRIRRHLGINQTTGKLNKGYVYTGKRLKSGIAEIKKVRKSTKKKGEFMGSIQNTPDEWGDFLKNSPSSPSSPSRQGIHIKNMRTNTNPFPNPCVLPKHEKDPTVFKKKWMDYYNQEIDETYYNPALKNKQKMYKINLRKVFDCYLKYYDIQHVDKKWDKYKKDILEFFNKKSSEAENILNFLDTLFVAEKTSNNAKGQNTISDSGIFQMDELLDELDHSLIFPKTVGIGGFVANTF